MMDYFLKVLETTDPTMQVADRMVPGSKTASGSSYRIPKTESLRRAWSSQMCMAARMTPWSERIITGSGRQGHSDDDWHKLCNELLHAWLK
ncbi:hypothetical protein Enr13x_16460 [Stieleria neptunia]|uniref:Uncharacterized protein n=1 Tax=Stieleria neptunia TaxID=2527979 RepID=A0A518HLT3_9BACT|nr:hypothetical protein [Stieleria neptunia]QDV41803.1 hypothetical protein Enr13x_16460 [Stieleria neptunia]